MFRTVNGGTPTPTNFHQVGWEPCPNSGGGTSGGTGGTSNGNGIGGSGTNAAGSSGSGFGGSNNNNSGGGGSGGGASSNNTVTTVPVPYPPEDGTSDSPCDKLKGLANPSRDAGSIKDNVDRLKAKVNSGDNNNEIGFESKRNINSTGEIIYTNEDITSSQNAQIAMNVDSDHIGGGHTHPINSYPMYSFGDLAFLLTAYENASNTRKSDVYYMLICKDGPNVKTYALKVDNIASLRTAINNELDKTEYNIYTTERLKIDAIHNNQRQFYENCQGNFEKMFLQFLTNYGVSLYNATDENLTNWNQLKLVGATSNFQSVLPIPCN